MKDMSSQIQMTQLEWQIKSQSWLLGMTDVKQTFSLSSRGRLADPKTLILFISFFSDSESDAEAFTKVVLAFNPHAEVKACSSRDAFTWRQEGKSIVLWKWLRLSCSTLLWQSSSDRAYSVEVKGHLNMTAWKMICSDIRSWLWLQFVVLSLYWAERTRVQAGLDSILNSNVPSHKLGTPVTGGTSQAWRGFCLYCRLMLLLTKAMRADWWQIRNVDKGSSHLYLTSTFPRGPFFLVANVLISGPTATPVKRSPQQCK